jgi:hypothetical protein
MDSMSNESPNLSLQDAHMHYWNQIPHWEEFHLAGPSMQQKCAVDRTKMLIPSKALRA